MVRGAPNCDGCGQTDLLVVLFLGPTFPRAVYELLHRTWLGLLHSGGACATPIQERRAVRHRFFTERAIKLSNFRNDDDVVALNATRCTGGSIHKGPGATALNLDESAQWLEALAFSMEHFTPKLLLKLDTDGILNVRSMLRLSKLLEPVIEKTFFMFGATVWRGASTTLYEHARLRSQYGAAAFHPDENWVLFSGTATRALLAAKGPRSKRICDGTLGALPSVSFMNNYWPIIMRLPNVLILAHPGVVLLGKCTLDATLGSCGHSRLSGHQFTHPNLSPHVLWLHPVKVAATYERIFEQMLSRAYKHEAVSLPLAGPLPSWAALVACQSDAGHVTASLNATAEYVVSAKEQELASASVPTPVLMPFTTFDCTSLLRWGVANRLSVVPPLWELGNLERHPHALHSRTVYAATWTAPAHNESVVHEEAEIIMASNTSAVTCDAFTNSLAVPPGDCPHR